MQRYFVEKIENDKNIIIKNDDYYHITKVMRMHTNDKVYFHNSFRDNVIHELRRMQDIFKNCVDYCYFTDIEIIKMEKSTPLILALAKDAESVTWFDKNGKLIHKLTLQEIGQSIKEAGELAGALQKYINDENIGHYLSY